METLINNIAHHFLGCHPEARVLCGPKDLCNLPALLPNSTTCIGPSSQRTLLRMTIQLQFSFIAGLAFVMLASQGSVHAQSHRIPEGIRQADQAEEQTQKNIPPPANQRPRMDPEKLRQDAADLATLAASIPADVDQAGKGILPKDLMAKLKQIEKLAKHLRGGLTQ
jgi:hypothetical protein